ncbi:unnamed protein product [Caenorhabditis nigoni]
MSNSRLSIGNYKKFLIILVILIFLLAGIGITLLVVLQHHGGSEGTATTSEISTNSTPSYTTTTSITNTTTITTKSPTITTTRITTQASEKTSINLEKTTVARSTSIETTYTTTQFQTTTPTDDTSCNSTNFPATFLFAYSNDLSSGTVLDSWKKFQSYRTFHSWFGSVRFDTGKIDVQFHKNKGDVTSTISKNLPNPKYGFQNSSIGSNVFEAIEKFFSNTQAPVCGSRVVVLLKRYSNEADISRLVSLIRYYHSIVHVIISATPSGGSQPKVMYSVASKTNGMGSFTNDEHFKDVIYYLPLYGPAYPVYATTMQVSGNGTQTLPDLNLPASSDYLIEITCQDHFPLDSFQKLTLRWANAGASGHLTVESSVALHGITLASGWNSFHEVNYSMSLDYNYTGPYVQNLQIRVYSEIVTNSWLPYSD